jgi:hypothetical protein
MPASATRFHAPPGGPRRARTGRLRAVVVGALTAVTLVGGAGAAQAATSSGILPGTRITAGLGEIQATAQRGDTFYIGGARGLAIRAAGVAAVDPTTGVLDRGVPELAVDASASTAVVERVVADRDAGVYALGVSSTTDGEVSVAGAPLPSDWVHLDASGKADASLALRFTDDAGNAANVYDVAVAADGVTYVSGAFTKVDGEARAGLAAVDANGTLTAWAPKIDAGRVERLYAAGTDVLLVGNTPGGGVPTFSAVGGQPRSGLALVAGDTGAPRAWAPEGLTEADAVQGVAVDGSTAFLATASAIKAVDLARTGTVRDLGVRPDGGIGAIAARGGALYVTGLFTVIGSQATQPSRGGLAELNPATGAATAWNPPSSRQGDALTVTDDAVYAGGASGYTEGSTGTTFPAVCPAAYSRATGQKTAWDPRLSGPDAATCQAPRSLAVSDGRAWAAGAFGSANFQVRNKLAAIDVERDEILPWAPALTDAGGRINDLELSPDGTTMFVAGSNMTALNGVPRSKVAAVAATGAAAAADDVRPWDPAPDNTVVDVAVAADGADVYLGGTFATVGGADRPRLAVTSASTGAAGGWRPAPDNTVNALEVAGDGTLYVGGSFTSIGTTAVARRRLAAFAGGSGEPTAWDPDVASGAVNDLALAEGVVYAGGTFNGVVGGQTRRGAAALDRATGTATSWNAELTGNVATVSTAADGTVYLIGASSSGFAAAQGKPRPSRLASVTPAGVVTGWSPGDDTRAYRPGDSQLSSEVREAGGLVLVPGLITGGFDGVPQRGFLGFGIVTTAPQATAKPTVLGRRAEGGTLTCRAGVYAGGSVTRTYAWLRDGVVIEGQTGVSYTARDADVGKDVACRETAENAVGPTSTDSDAVRIVRGVPTSDLAPEVTGTPRVGQTVRCTEGLWSNVPTGYRFAWLRDGVVIGGATTAEYGVAAADAGKALSCEVTAVNDAGASAGARSAVVRVPAPPVDGGNQSPGNQSPGGETPGDQTPTTPTTATPIPTTPTPTTPTPPSPGPNKPTPPAAKPKLSVSAKAVGLKGRAIALTVSPPGPGRVTVSATTGTGKKRVTVGSGRATAKKAGALKLTVKPSAKGKKALKAGRTAKVTFKVTFTAANGTKVTVTKTIKVKIKR